MSDLFIITKEELDRANSNIDGIEAKPLVLCGECKKWKTLDCLHREVLTHYLGKPGEVPTEIHTTESITEPDDFCKDGIKA